MIKKSIFSLIFIATSLILISWGNTGHRIISGSAFLSFNSEMTQFLDWKSFLVDHASDPDTRRNNDPAEGPKHYIDIDNYPEFVSNGRIAQTWDSIVAEHDYTYVINNGVLPWATLATYDSLKACFARRDWNKAKIFAADLGHYVADGYMPLHVTANYDGKFTGNSGIHSRYESSMVNTYASQLTYSGDSVRQIENVNQYIFNYLYRNHSYVDSVLAADNYAKSINSNTSSAEYNAALWLKTKGYTLMLFREASISLSRLFYSAWVEAGRPLISGGFYHTDITSVSTVNRAAITSVFPNPFSEKLSIHLRVDEPSFVKMEIRDSSGKIMDTLQDSKLQTGEFSFLWSPDSLVSGMYFISLQAGRQTIVRPVIYEQTD
ncbi:MAG: T9SS type A sorting domain-containing protein [Bacteroidales bacterium]|nr:T9SS type A sorting domain-containing protein [Bacteroidales bacterium]MCB8998920.1 T9SS type A sorting domain-containing protein [Bacteroidales bacterium]